MEKQTQYNFNANLKQNKLSSELIWKASYDKEVASISLSCDGRSAAVTFSEGRVGMLDAVTGAEKYSIETGAPLFSTQLDEISADAFSFGRNAVARIDGAGKLMWRKNIQTPIIAAAISQYSKNFILCYEGNKIVIADYNAVPRYKGGVDSKGPISAIYSPKYSDNFAVVTIAGDVFYMRFDGQILWQFCIKDHLNSVSTSKDGKIIFIGSRENKLLGLHADQKALFNFELKSPVICTDISEDGKYFAVGCSDGCVYILNEGGETIFYDKPFSTVSKIFLSDNAEKILTLSDARDVSMYRVGQRKSVEEKSKNLDIFIELDSAFKSGGTNIDNREGRGIEAFIEL